MSDAAAAPAQKVKTPKKKAPAKPKKPANHPKYSEMIKAAVAALKERGGSSRQAILKYILANFNVGKEEKSVNAHLKLALRAGVKNASLKQAKGTGASGSFRIGEVKKAAKPKKAKKPKAAKPKAKKPKAKKAAKPRRPRPRRRLNLRQEGCQAQEGCCTKEGCRQAQEGRCQAQESCSQTQESRCQAQEGCCQEVNSPSALTTDIGLLLKLTVKLNTDLFICWNTV